MEGEEAKKMMPEFYSPPGIVKMIFPNFIWESQTDMILITIDDGPSKHSTENILKFLDTHKIKALMFFVGEEIKKNPQQVKEVISAGHMIGCHSMNHIPLTKLNYRQICEDFSVFNIEFKKESGTEIKYVRPPYGRFNLNVMKALKNSGLTGVMWSLLTFDYKNDFDIVKFALEKYLRKNSIVVFHDNQKSKEIVIDSLKYLSDKASALGFRIGEPSECLK